MLAVQFPNLNSIYRTLEETAVLCVPYRWFANGAPGTIQAENLHYSDLHRIMVLYFNEKEQSICSSVSGLRKGGCSMASLPLALERVDFK
jgi:hypothetical protein